MSEEARQREGPGSTSSPAHHHAASKPATRARKKQAQKREKNDDDAAPGQLYVQCQRWAEAFIVFVARSACVIIGILDYIHTHNITGFTTTVSIALGGPTLKKAFEKAKELMKKKVESE